MFAFFKNSDGILYSWSAKWKQHLHAHHDAVSPERLATINAQILEILNQRHEEGFVFPKDADELVRAEFVFTGDNALMANNNAANRLLDNTPGRGIGDTTGASFRMIPDIILWSEWNYDQFCLRDELFSVA